MFKTNKEIEEVMDNRGGSSWIFAYTDDSEFYIPNALHVERNDELMLVENDVQACEEAQKDGVPFIDDMLYISNKTYVDTEENRNIITDYLFNNINDNKMKLYYLSSNEGTLLLLVRANEKLMEELIQTMKEEQEKSDYRWSDEEALIDLFVRRKIDYEILKPIKLEW